MQSENCRGETWNVPSWENDGIFNSTPSCRILCLFLLSTSEGLFLYYIGFYHEHFMYAIMMDLFLVWWMKLNKLSVYWSQKAERWRNGFILEAVRVGHSIRGWRPDFLSKVQHDYYEKTHNTYNFYYKNLYWIWSSCSKKSRWVHSDVEKTCV